MDTILFFVASMIGTAADAVLILPAIVIALALPRSWQVATAAVALGLAVELLVAMIAASGPMPYPFPRFLAQRIAAAALIMFAVRGIRALARRLRSA